MKTFTIVVTLPDDGPDADKLREQMLKELGDVIETGKGEVVSVKEETQPI